MAAYWKSNDRHFCTFCKCWLAGNKISIQLHESGNHHKGMVKAKVDQLRKASEEKGRQEKQFNETLGQMERAANESFRRDMVASVSDSPGHSAQNLAASSSSDANLPSKLKRPISQPVQVQCKKPKFVIKTPAPKPVFEPIEPVPEKVEVKLSEEIQTPLESNEQPEPVPEHIEAELPDETETPPVITMDDTEGIWYESKTEAQDLFYWNDVTGETTWTTPVVYLSIEQQRAKGLIV